MESEIFLYTGCCTRCEIKKEEFELRVRPYDLLICQQCLFQVKTMQLLKDKLVDEYKDYITDSE